MKDSSSSNDEESDIDEEEIVKKKEPKKQKKNFNYNKFVQPISLDELREPLIRGEQSTLDEIAVQ